MRRRSAEPSIQRSDHSTEFILSRIELANLGACSRHRSEPDDVTAFGALAEAPATAGKLQSRLFQFVGKTSSKTRRLLGVRLCRPNPLLANSHGGNLTGPLGSCHTDHIIAGAMA